MGSLENHIKFALINSQGLCLAITLQSTARAKNINCTIYERRASAGTLLGESIVLTPSSLRILEGLGKGLYQNLLEHGIELQTAIIKDENFKTLRIEQMGNRSFDYPTLRLRRHDVIQVLTDKVLGLGTKILYGHNFDKIIYDGTDAVRFRFKNGVEKSSTFLVGADGIWSKVRSNAFPEWPKPEYTGQVGIVWNIPTADFEEWTRGFGYDFDPSASLISMSTTYYGVTSFTREDRENKHICTTSFRQLSGRSQEEWAAFSEDRDAILSALRNDGGEPIPEPVKSAIEYATKNLDVNIFIWPMLMLHTLNHMVSHEGKGRTILIGDAAHGFPPTGGQGANMAIEDTETLALIFESSRTLWTLQQAPGIWENWRMNRLARVRNYMDAIRKYKFQKNQDKSNEDSEETAAKETTGQQWEKLAWLHGYNAKEDMIDWIRAGQSSKAL